MKEDSKLSGIIQILLPLALISLVFAAASSPSAAAATSAEGLAPEAKLVMASSETGSSGHVKVSLMANMISKATNNRIRISVIPTAGTPDAVTRLQNSEVDVMGLGTIASLYDSIKGVGKRAGMAPFQMYAIFPIGLSPFQAIMRGDAPIETWDDLEGKKVAGGTPGSAGAVNTLQWLEVAGLTNKCTVVNLSFAAAVNALKDRKIDLSFMYTGAPNPLVMEFQTREPIKMLDFPQSMVDKMSAKYFNNEAVWAILPIGKDVYPNLVRPGKEATAIQVASVRKEMSDRIAYWLAKTYWEGLPDLKKQNTQFREHNADVIRAVPQKLVPWHPGALKYYKEQGILQ
jgi:TRAP transporter TAXI family solute receptor